MKQLPYDLSANYWTGRDGDRSDVRATIFKAVKYRPVLDTFRSFSPPSEVGFLYFFLFRFRKKLFIYRPGARCARRTEVVPTRQSRTRLGGPRVSGRRTKAFRTPRVILKVIERCSRPPCCETFAYLQWREFRCDGHIDSIVRIIISSFGFDAPILSRTI